MAKYDPERIAETADPFAPGTTGIEPLCDEFGRLIAAPTGGGGGGDASAANQVLALTALDSIYDALALVGTEATSADILAAVNSLGAGATLADLAAALAPLATEATQIDILDALTAQGVDIAASKAAIDLLVPDLDAVRVASESTASAVGTTADTDAGSTVVALLKWIKARLPVSLGGKTSAGSLSVTMATDQTAIPSSNAVSSQADGHSATIGATADADTALTLVGLIKWIKARLPTALVSGRFDGNMGAWLGSTGPTVGQKVIGLSIPVVIASDQPSVAVKGPGVSAPATSVSTVYASNTRTANGAPTLLVAATLFTTGQTKLNKLELRYPGAGTRYVWIFDKATNAVTATDSAHLPIPITNAQGLVIVDLSTVQLNLSAGLVVSLSTTEFTYTLETSGFYARPTWQ